MSTFHPFLPLGVGVPVSTMTYRAAAKARQKRILLVTAANAASSKHPQLTAEIWSESKDVAVLAHAFLKR
jgi:alkanesulfonate monooxygenase SsuD/methylene tetrahydromethanopterin reductase-like flavin-dependent oxidoreductase (luciferase family)